MKCSLAVGNTVWTVDTPTVTLPVYPSRTADIPAEDLVRNALENPFEFEALRKALTPDDHIALVVDDKLPNLVEMLSAILAHVVSAGVDPAAITVIVPHSTSNQSFVDSLPDEFSEVTVETHNAKDDKRHAYLATTKAGRRIYLNRSLVESDFMIVLTGTKPRTLSGRSLLFPLLSNEETQAAELGEEEPEEVMWLLGTPFFVSVVEGLGDTVARVVAGLKDSLEEAKRVHNECWLREVNEEADLAVVPLAGDRIGFAEWAAAVRASARAVVPGGRIAVLSTSAGTEGLISSLREHETVEAAARKLPAGFTKEWATVARKYRLNLASGLTDEITEEIFATAIHNENELQRLIDSASQVIILPDAHKTRVRRTVAE